MNISRQDNEQLLDAILRLLHSKGFKRLTMDNVASELKMSKRTLYEIFGSKNEMISKAVKRDHDVSVARFKAIFESGKNMMEAMVEAHSFHAEMLSGISPDYFRDMDDFFPEIRSAFKQVEDKRHAHFMRMFRKGVSQGVFRPDVNYEVQTRIFDVQLEALKRMEEIFPSGIPVTTVYETITIGSLRSVASPEGMRILDELTSSPDGMPTLLGRKKH